MPADCNVILREDKSFVYDLDVQRGIVSSRVALLLRSAEIKPLLSDLFFFLLIFWWRVLCLDLDVCVFFSGSEISTRGGVLGTMLLLLSALLSILLYCVYIFS